MTKNEAAVWVLKLCQRNQYQLPLTIDETRYACIAPMAFNDTIIIGKYGDEAGWDEQYWYERQMALPALLEWCADGFEGEPQGWHRHIPSNRRREGGDPAKEEVRP